jgi:hypothetical protein
MSLQAAPTSTSAFVAAGRPAGAFSAGRPRISSAYPTPATVPTTAHRPHSHSAPYRSMTTPDVSGATSAATAHDMEYMPW